MGETQRIVLLATQDKAKKIADAHADAEKIKAAAHLKARDALSESHTQAKWMQAPVLAFGFNQSRELKCWQPVLESPPASIHAENALISDIVADSKTKRLYWAVPDRGVIMSANLDGTDKQVVFHANAPQSLALDTDNDKIFWISNFSCIMQGELNGSQAMAHVLDIPSFLGELKYMKLGMVTQSDGTHVFYWADGCQIMKATGNADIKAVVTSEMSPQPTYVAVDHARGQLYWMDERYKHIMKAGLDGTAPSMVCAVEPMYINKGLSVDEVLGDVYFINKVGDDTVLQRYNSRSAEVDDVMALGPDNKGWGLSLNIKATSLQLQDSLTQRTTARLKSAEDKVAVSKRAANSISEAHENKQQKIRESQDAVDAAGERAAQARQDNIRKRADAQEASARDIAKAQADKNQNIEAKRQHAQAMVQQAHGDAAEKRAAAQARLNDARRKQRDTMH